MSSELPNIYHCGPWSFNLMCISPFCPLHCGCPQSSLLCTTAASTLSLPRCVGVGAHSDATCIFFHLPSRHFVVRLLKFPSPVWCRQKSKMKKTAQIFNTDMKTEKKTKSRTIVLGLQLHIFASYAMSEKDASTSLTSCLY